MNKHTLTNEGDDIVQEDLDKLRDAVGDYCSVILYGSFGKGEGLVLDGVPRNDYDILVIDSKDSDAFVKRADRREYAGRMEYVFSTSEKLNVAECTQELFEIRYGSIPITGVQAPLPRWEPYDIPYADAVNSINRRILSLLIGKHEIMNDDPDFRKATEQIIKAIIAVGDAMLIKRGEFHHHYRTRALMLSMDPIGNAYQQAVRMKLTGTPTLTEDQVWSYWNQGKAWVREYCAENHLNPPLFDALLQVTDRTSQEDLAQLIELAGGSDWL